MLCADDGVGCAVTESCLLRVARMSWWKGEGFWGGENGDACVWEREVATNVLSRALREGALCGPVKCLLVVDHLTFGMFNYFAYVYMWLHGWQ